MTGNRLEQAIGIAKQLWQRAGGRDDYGADKSSLNASSLPDGDYTDY